MASLNETPSASRLHIGVFGRTNSGKSSLVNAFTGQKASIVSDVAGTTTDPVYKPMEILPLGPCVLIDTAGFNDEGELGKLRMEKTRLAAAKTDIALLVISGEEKAPGEGQSFREAFPAEQEWLEFFRGRKTPVLFVVSKADRYPEAEGLAAWIKERTQEEALCVCSPARQGMEELKEALVRRTPEGFGMGFITGDLVKEGDSVLLVMPQDIQAPKGRLILPQVQTLRELLDKKCLVMSATADRLEEALGLMNRAPKLIITDSQVFGYVYEHKPKESMLTSFSVLFAAYKGDLPYYMEGARQIDALTPDSRVLIAECCTHAPLSEDIGRVKLPRMLRKRVGEALRIDMVSGTDYPKDLSGYDLVIQCGACMFNKTYVLSRIGQARRQKVPMTNYGVAIAHLTGILDKISTPG